MLIRDQILRVYEKTVSVLVIGLVVVMIAMMLFAFLDVVRSLIIVAPSINDISINDREFRDLVSSVLDVFVVIELFGTIVNYAKVRRVVLPALIDVVAVFTLREMLIILYGHTVPSTELLALALLLIGLVIARTIANRFPPLQHPRD